MLPPIFLINQKFVYPKMLDYVGNFVGYFNSPYVKNVGECQKMLENVRYNTENHDINDAA